MIKDSIQHECQLFLGAELHYNSVCHNVTMSQCHAILTLEYYNYTLSGPIFTKFYVLTLLTYPNKLTL